MQGEHPREKIVKDQELQKAIKMIGFNGIRFESQKGIYQDYRNRFTMEVKRNDMIEGEYNIVYTSDEITFTINDIKHLKSVLKGDVTMIRIEGM